MAVPTNHWLSALAHSSLLGVPGTELFGTWLDSWSTSMEYSLARNAYDFETRLWFGGHANPWDVAPYRGFGLSLADDGTFLWVRGEDTGVARSIHVIRGTFSVERSVVRFHAAAQRQHYEHTGDPSRNFDVDLPNEDLAMTYALGATPEGGLATLRLIDATSGTTFVYFRQ